MPPTSGVKRRSLIIPPPPGFGAWAGQRLRARSPVGRGINDVHEIATGSWADSPVMTFASLLYLRSGEGGYIIADRSSGAQLVYGLFVGRQGMFRNYTTTNMDCNGTNDEYPLDQWFVTFGVDNGPGVPPDSFFGVLGEDCVESGYGTGRNTPVGTVVAATHWDVLARGHGSGSSFPGQTAWLAVFDGALTQDQCSEISRLWRMPLDIGLLIELFPGMHTGTIIDVTGQQRSAITNFSALELSAPSLWPPIVFSKKPTVIGLIASVPVIGIADFSLPGLSITGIGDTLSRFGIADFNLPVPTITSVGDVPIAGTADFNLPVPTITGIGDIPIVGIADFNLPVPTITAFAGGRVGSADFALPALDITGIGNIPIDGIADFNIPILAITGIGDTLSRFGDASFNLPILAITALGNIPIDGTADFNLPTLTIPAIGDILVKGVADFDLPNLGLSSTGVVGALGSRTGMADFNLPSLWINTQGGVDIPMVNIFSTSGQTGAETGTAFTLSRKAGTWFINRDVLAQVILGSGSATIHIEVSLDGGSTFADITSSVTASTISAFNLPPIIRVRLSAATAATVNVWLDADLVVTRVNS